VVHESDEAWLSVIAKSLAYLCLKQAEKDDAKKMAGLINKVRFLKGLGLSQNAAAEAVGSSPASIAEMIRQEGKKKGGRTRGAASKSRK
jgi:hypothetical protein